MSVPPPDPALPGLDGYVKQRRPRKESTKIVVKVGAVSLPVYRLKDRWMVVYRDAKGAERQRLSFQTEKAARTKAAEICLEIARGKVSVDRLSPDSRLQAATAEKILGPLGLTLDGAAREIAGAHELTGGAGILEMARFWAKHHEDALAPAQTLPEIHASLLKSIEKQDFSPRWRQALKKDLKHFVDAFAERPIAEIVSDEIQTWLDAQRGNWRTFNNRLRLIRQFFNYARKKKLLPQAGETEAKKVDPRQRPRGAHNRIGVLSAGELADVLAHVGAAWLPFVALGAFAGMRRAEIERLDWLDVRWEERLIHVRQEVAKSTRRRAGDERFIPMRDQLLAWLEPWRGHVGPVCTRKRFEDELGRLRVPHKDEKGTIIREAVIRGLWPKNALRHTYGSCRMGEVKNMPQVADEMGNSVAEVRRDYRNPRTEREVAAWASLLPPTATAAGLIPFLAVSDS